MFILVTLTSFAFLTLINSEFVIPDVEIKALEPQGFTVSLQDQPGIKLFGFHAKLNEEIAVQEVGLYFGDVRQPWQGHWTYHNQDLALKPGDVLYYWVYVQHDFFGYRKDNLKWTVPSNSNKTEDSFEDWALEQFIPNSGPDYEFVYYSKDPSIVIRENETIFIKLQVEDKPDKLMGVFDLTRGCTRTGKDCSTNFGFFFRPPIASGRLVSKKAFSLGRFEIQAQLPQGDWIFPQIFLESTMNSNVKIWLAYARGNKILKGSSGDDIGGSILFAGPVLEPQEPQRSRHLISTRLKTLLSDKLHLFSFEWTNRKMSFFLDQQLFGSILLEDELNYLQFHTFRLVLGLGVGGLHDFPDNYTSSENHPKPWTNGHRNQIKTFYQDKANWLKTWTHPKLIISHVSFPQN